MIRHSHNTYMYHADRNHCLHWVPGLLNKTGTKQGEPVLYSCHHVLASLGCSNIRQALQHASPTPAIKASIRSWSKFKSHWLQFPLNLLLEFVTIRATCSLCYCVVQCLFCSHSATVVEMSLSSVQSSGSQRVYHTDQAAEVMLGWVEAMVLVQ